MNAVIYLTSKGFDSIPHAYNKSLLIHCISVSELLLRWGASTSVASAGLFHSCYGRSVTKFNGIDLSERDKIKTLIGAEAEQLAYLSCAMSEESFLKNSFNENAKFSIFDRFLNVSVTISKEVFGQLLVINVANMFDHIQVDAIENFKWPSISFYIQMIDFLPSIAKNDFEQRFHI